MNDRYRRAVRGFSILELLVVIAIIMLLVSSLFFAVGKVRDTVRKNQTKNIIQRVYDALDSYKLNFRAYPPDTTPVTAGSLTNGKALYYWLTTTFRTGVNASINADPVLVLEKQDFGTDNGTPYIRDAWATPLVYKNDKGYILSYDASGNLIAANAATLYTIKPVIYSIGLNKRDDTNPAGGIPPADGVNDDVGLGQ